jgi:hypothetical protein
MDLSLQNNGLITQWSLDENTELITITFYDITKTVVLGDIVIEKNRLRAFSDILGSVALYFSPEVEINTTDGQRTRFDNQTLEGVTKWE